TTKPGTRGKTTYNVSYVYGITNPTKVPEMMDAALFSEVMNETFSYLGSAPYKTAEEIQKYRDGSDPILYPNTNWADVSLNRNTPQQRLNLQARSEERRVGKECRCRWSPCDRRRKRAVRRDQTTRVAP